MVLASEIAKFLSKELIGNDIHVNKPCSLDSVTTGGVTFAKKYSEEFLQLMNTGNSALFIVTPEYAGKLSSSHIISENPRLDFAKLLAAFFQPKKEPSIAPTARLGKNVKLGGEVIVGEYSVIGDNVSIGDGTEIRHHVVIADNVTIGRNCLIKSNTVIGEEGFGFERDEDQVPVRLPHLGRVVIGDNVEIGALNTVLRGTLENTTIEDNVKTDDHVHVAHNVYIEKNTMVTACAEISGSAKIGANSWLGPNCSIMNGISLGENVLVGLGAVVTKSVESNAVVAGNPARRLR